MLSRLQTSHMPVTDYDNMSIQACKANCANPGDFEYYALAFGSMCSCANDLPRENQRMKDDICQLVSGAIFPRF